MVWPEGTEFSAPEPPMLSEAEVIDRRDGLLTLRSRGAALPPTGTLLEGRDLAGAVIATLVLSKHVTVADSSLAIAELVTGSLAEVVVVGW